jgi:hypothetical protein
MVGTDRRAVRAHAKVLRKRLFLRAALSAIAPYLSRFRSAHS